MYFEFHRIPTLELCCPIKSTPYIYIHIYYGIEAAGNEYQTNPAAIPLLYSYILRIITDITDMATGVVRGRMRLK